MQVNESNKFEKWFPYTVIDQLLCIMNERRQKDSEDKKLFDKYINTINHLVQTKYL